MSVNTLDDMTAEVKKRADARNAELFRHLLEPPPEAVAVHIFNSRPWPNGYGPGFLDGPRLRNWWGEE